MLDELGETIRLDLPVLCSEAVDPTMTVGREVVPIVVVLTDGVGNGRAAVCEAELDVLNGGDEELGRINEVPVLNVVVVEVLPTGGVELVGGCVKVAEAGVVSGPVEDIIIIIAVSLWIEAVLYEAELEVLPLAVTLGAELVSLGSRSVVAFVEAGLELAGNEAGLELAGNEAGDETTLWVETAFKFEVEVEFGKGLGVEFAAPVVYAAFGVGGHALLVFAWPLE